MEVGEETAVSGDILAASGEDLTTSVKNPGYPGIKTLTFSLTGHRKVNKWNEKGQENNYQDKSQKKISPKEKGPCRKQKRSRTSREGYTLSCRINVE